MISLIFLFYGLLMISVCEISGKSCLHPNYVTENRKIYAVHPDDETDMHEIRIRGVNWSGMENVDTSMLLGLWGRESTDPESIKGTSVSKVASFLSKEGFNSIRIPLSYLALMKGSEYKPKLELIHKYDNPELASSKTYLDILQQTTKALQEKQISVLLDLHTLSTEPKDKLWYRGEYKQNIEETELYQALEYLATNMCGDEYWNVLGLDLKNEPYEALWNEQQADEKVDWKIAAEKLGNMVLKKCPKWLIFVEGVGNSLNNTHTVSTSYPEKYGDWHGANLRNAMKNKVNLMYSNKLVLSPHAYSHGVFPQNYFYTAQSSCTYDTASTGEDMCVDYLKGQVLTNPKHKCQTTKFSCAKGYEHLSDSQLISNVDATIEGMFGYLSKDSQSPPIVMGEFGGVFGTHQPKQTIVLKRLIELISNSYNGGYFWSLNPESEYYLEDAMEGSSYFPRTHYGLMELNDWEKPHADLLEELKKLPSSEIPCFESKSNSKGFNEAEDTNSFSTKLEISNTLGFILFACICMFM